MPVDGTEPQVHNSGAQNYCGKSEREREVSIKILKILTILKVNCVIAIESRWTLRGVKFIGINHARRPVKR